MTLLGVASLQRSPDCQNLKNKGNPVRKVSTTPSIAPRVSSSRKFATQLVTDATPPVSWITFPTCGISSFDLSTSCSTFRVLFVHCQFTSSHIGPARSCTPDPSCDAEPLLAIATNSIRTHYQTLSIVICAPGGNMTIGGAASVAGPPRTRSFTTAHAPCDARNAIEHTGSC